MRVIRIALVVLLFSIISAFSQKYFYDDYVLSRASSNFNGSVFNESAIIVYGDAGVLLRSVDRGIKWEQVNLNDSLNILEMVNCGSVFYGISYQRYMIRSDDNGKNWQLKDFGDNVRFYRLFYYNSQIYALMDGKIRVFNQNLEQTEEYTFTVDSIYFDGALAGSKLVYPAGKGRLGFIQLGNGQTGSIDLSSLGICSGCPVPTRLFSNKTNIIYFTLGKNLYQYDFADNTAKFAFMPLKLTMHHFTPRVMMYSKFIQLNFRHKILIHCISARQIKYTILTRSLSNPEMTGMLSVWHLQI